MSLRLPNFAYAVAKLVSEGQAWTEFAGGRHQRRVNKIMDVEKRFLRK